jgi:U3 small nucleolar RNA-associated protein 14
VVQDGSERLDPPLPKVHADQLQRKAMFVEASNKISEWLPTIKKNREADHLYFTHQEGKPPHPSLNILVESHKPRTPLEKEISQLLSNSEHAVPSPQDGLTAAERRSLERMALQEAKLRRQELLTMKSLMFYQERRFRREKKIKSKKFHKVRRRRKDKEAQKGKDLDEQDVHKALQARAKERMTLKHSSHSKWAKKLKQTKNTDLKQLVTDIHQIGQGLKEKTEVLSESASESSDNELYPEEEVEDSIEQVPAPYETTIGNPWLSTAGVRASHRVETGEDRSLGSDPSGSVGPGKGETMVADMADSEDEGPVLSQGEEPSRQLPPNQSTSLKMKKSQVKRRNIDIRDVLVMDVDSEDVDKMASANEQLLSIRSAFANDDVVEEFVREKKDLEKEGDGGEEAILPGWGAWAGEGTKPPKKKPHPSKMATKPPRKDSHLKHVIISEGRDRKFTKHQVSKVPFPFQNQNQFEKATCHPIGKHWNSEATFQQIIRPKVLSEPGVVITPIHKTN